MTIPMLKSFLDSLEEGVLFLDKNRNVVAANRAATQMIGHEEGSRVNLLCPSIFKGTECAQACEKRGSCALNPDWKASDITQNIVLPRPDNSSVFLRMWAIFLPPAENISLYCAIILRDRSHEVELEQEVTEGLQLGSMVGHSPACRNCIRK